MRRGLLLGTLCLLGTGAFAMGKSPPAMRDFTLRDPDGKPVALSDFKGKVVLLNFWAAWCDGCREELPVLRALHDKYRDRGFSVLGVYKDAIDAKALAARIKESRIDYPVVSSGVRAPPGYPVFGLPTSFLIDRHGAIVKKYSGPQTYETLARDVEALLESAR